MKNFLLPLAILACTVTSAQHSGNMYYGQKREITSQALHAEINADRVTFTVSGLMNADAEYYVAFFNVIQVGENAQQTNALLTSRIKQFKTSLATIGIDTLNVHRDFISFVPKYDYNVFNRVFSTNFNEIPDGFEMQINLSIQYRNQHDLDAIVAAATTAEIYDLAKVDYFITDIDSKYESLRNKCTQLLANRIMSFEKLGFKPDTLAPAVAEDFNTILPHTRYSQYEAVARPSFRAVKKATGSDAGKVLSSGNSSTTIYHAQSFDQFDVVVNPVVSHPMIQLTYELKASFELKKSEGKTIHVLKQDGQLQPLIFHQ